MNPTLAPADALHDADLAERILAELADPLHPEGLDHARITPEDFYDHADRRIARVLLAQRAAGLPPVRDDYALMQRLLGSGSDAIRLRDLVRQAWPMTSTALDDFLELAHRRRRLEELEIERSQLLGDAA